MLESLFEPTTRRKARDIRRLFSKKALVTLGVLVGVLAVTLGVAARGSHVQVPEGSPVSEEEANAAYSRVLETRVDERGRVDFEGLASDLEDLETYLRWVASAEESRMTEDERLTFHINAYNALAMYNVVRQGFPEDFETLLDKVRFFYLPKQDVGGERISLYDLENDVIRQEGDARIHHALNCMAVGCPVLPREPFTAEDLQTELDRETRTFFNEDRNVRVDDENRTVRVTELMDLYPDDYLADAPSLLAYVNEWREEPVPEDYEVEFIPYDWTLNRQP